MANAALDEMALRQSSPRRTSIWRSMAQPGCLTTRRPRPQSRSLPRCGHDGVGADPDERQYHGRRGVSAPNVNGEIGPNRPLAHARSPRDNRTYRASFARRNRPTGYLS